MFRPFGLLLNYLIFQWFDEFQRTWSRYRAHFTFKTSTFLSMTRSTYKYVINLVQANNQCINNNQINFSCRVDMKSFHVELILKVNNNINIQPCHIIYYIYIHSIGPSCHKNDCNIIPFLSFDLFMVYKPECKQKLMNYEIIHADTRYCTL